MKRFLALLMAIGMIATTLTACGPSKPAETTAEVTTAAPTEATTAEKVETTAPKVETTAETTVAELKLEPTDVEWAKNATFYEIFVRSFCDSNGDGIGDLNGIASKIDYLKELNIDAIWLMPIMESTTYHGYDVVDYKTVNPDYGTIDDFKNLVKVCHESDIKIILDFVANHTSSENPWFKEAMANKESPYRKYYSITDKERKTSGWRYDEATKQYFYGLYDSIMPDLNYNKQEVRDSMNDAANFWLDLDVDGFRLDGSNNINTDPNITHGWWQEFAVNVKSHNNKAYIVGENWEPTAAEIAPFYGEMDGSFNFEAARILEDMANGSNNDIIKILNEGVKLYKEAHDVNKEVVTDITNPIMINNHDMDRIATRLRSTEKAKLAASLQLTLPCTPFIYYGDELGQLGKKPDDNRREPFDWYKSAKGEGMTVMNDKFFNPGAYTLPDDGISLEEEREDPNSIFNHYKKLLQIRHDNKAFYTGTYETVGMTDGLYSYTITEGSDKYLVVHNQGEKAHKFNILVDGKDLYNDVDIKATKDYELAPCTSLIMKYDSADKPTDMIYEEEKIADPQDYNITVKATMPENTPEKDPIHIVGTFNNWVPDDKNYIMKRTSPTTAEITFTVNAIPKSKLEYKFERGNWDKREQNIKGQDLVGDLQMENRIYEFKNDTAPVLEIVIEKWSDID